MNITMIPLNQLVPSLANVRKIGADTGIEELAASIDAHGLLQNLQVQDSAKGKFEVVAGGRRLKALKLLVKRKKMAKNAEIACHILDTEDAGEISLAENTLRLPMHPADQFTAFFALTESGKGIEEIAARFGTSPAVVRQRLKLASVSPTLIDLYRADQMSLDQLMAFTVCDDHEGQEAAWFEQPDWQHDPVDIRNYLTAAHVEADDRRVRLVGLDIYKEKGGCIVRDLFQPEHEGYLTDPALLDRLVVERLEAEAAAVRAEGWHWVEIMPRLDYATLHSFDRIEPEQVPLDPEQQEEFDRLWEEHDALTGEDDEDVEPEVVAQLDALMDQIEALTEGTKQWQPADFAVAGAIVSVDPRGTLQIERGLLRAADRPARKALRNGQADETRRDSAVLSNDPASALSARLVEDLTAERTMALRAMMQENEAVAIASVAHALALPVFYPHAYNQESCLDLRLVSVGLGASSDTIAESGAAILLAARHAAWEERLPAEATELFGWLVAQDRSTITGLIAFCAAMSVDAVRGKQDRPDCPRLAHADQLATALGLDMAVWWQPTKSRYLGRVSKSLILGAVGEGVSRQCAENLAGLKKDDLIARAETKLSGTGWLPPILQSPPLVPVSAPVEAKTMQEAAE